MLKEFFLWYNNGTGWFDCAQRFFTLEEAIEAAESGWQTEQYVSADANGENIVWRMAVAAMQAHGDSIPCPLCGKPMQWESVAWFCRSGPRRHGVGATFEPCRAQCKP